MYIPRTITSHLKSMLGKFPVLSLTGPRQSGKTTLLRKAFPEYTYMNLERFDQRDMVLDDPVAFLMDAGSKVIFDEAQRAPSLFSYIQTVSDTRNVPGQYILSGSQSFLLNEQISQTLAGRIYISHLFPFDITEVSDKIPDLQNTIWKGFYPRLLDTGIAPYDFFPSYIQTYIERDIRTLKAIENLHTFSRFLSLCAGRTGQVLNISSLANDTGISVNTARSWLSLLESSFIIFLLQPYYRNFSKRSIKSPKLYFFDTGVAASLLKINDPQMIKQHFLYGGLFENLIISELIKYGYHSGLMPSVYYWRESNGTEIDCILEKSYGKITTIEIKAGETYTKDYLKNLNKFPADQASVDKYLIYAGDQSAQISDVRLTAWSDFPGLMNQLIN